ncbi:RNA-guided endonuclease TnpB family protein [Paenibacillus sabinae]|uniref:Transposase, IS605 OrfB family protein n=1 Tax=Paenibacillus sabinae T27 TaxID=1268072 RepID=X5A4M9_9BACL|nr:RNA-guided endonuclease TnpB family protein [Paenibacillus sabinae]AHV98744.1 transposase, IS605 OrfB family protein [Paenibacillus sabinae T27]
MKVVKTLKHPITSHHRMLDATLHVYQEALSFLITVIQEQFMSLVSLSTQAVVTAVERLTHRTRHNPNPLYAEFDQRFYKFPSYFRRSAIAEAFGILKSHHSRFELWQAERQRAQQEGKRFSKKPPTLEAQHRAFPCLYKGNMFIRTSDRAANIKIFHQGDWIWLPITFKGQDLFKRNVWSMKECSPTLVRKGKRYALHIAYEGDVKLTQTEFSKQRVCAVDLGLTNSAVCSVMDASGTVLARTFINQAKEKDRMRQITGKLKQAQCQSGIGAKPNFWRRMNGLQTHIVHDTAHQILAFAQKHRADVIVMEYLGKMRLPKGTWGAKRFRTKLQFWAKRRIQTKVTEMAHFLGMRVSMVSPANTSALAFDGSGFVQRNTKRDVAVFATGKTYHADLNASYNIGARYVLRNIQKSTSEKTWLSLEAKDPSLAKRTYWTLASLIRVQQALGLQS